MYPQMLRKMLNCCSRQKHINISRILFNCYHESAHKQQLRSWRYYWSGLGVLALGISYASVPLYKVFCQAYNYGGTITINHDASKIPSLVPVKDKVIKIRFNADTGATMAWNFKPQQKYIKVIPGETALAFYTAKNPLDEPVIGISTYNVIPYEAAQYFNKIQCFCFEEQQLNPHEEVDMPVFFYIDPAIMDDSKMEDIEEIVLSYTFFRAKEGIKIPLPGFMKKE